LKKKMALTNLTLGLSSVGWRRGGVFHEMKIFQHGHTSKVAALQTSIAQHLLEVAPLSNSDAFRGMEELQAERVAQQTKIRHFISSSKPLMEPVNFLEMIAGEVHVVNIQEKNGNAALVLEVVQVGIST
jgi:hypothetical protein